MKSFQGKVAVVTGAGSGIGRALAIALAGEGAQLALSDIDEAGLAETRRLLPAETRVRTYRLDVTSEAAFCAHADEVRRDFGTAHLLFNNAGTTLVGLFENQTVDEMRWLVDVNLWGVVHGTKAFLPMMLAQREGCIVNMSSVLGLVGFPSHSAYSLTKFAVRGLTEALWWELEGTGVEAVCVHPGGIITTLDTNARYCAKSGEAERRLFANITGTMRTSARQCAREILDGVRRGKRRVVTGHLSSLLFWVTRLFPNRYPSLLRSYAR